MLVFLTVWDSRPATTALTPSRRSWIFGDMLYMDLHFELRDAAVSCCTHLYLWILITYAAW